MSKLPFSVFTVNCFVTLFPAASFTTAFPVTLLVYLPASFPVTVADNPVTVYLFPFTSNVVASNPDTVWSFPSYVAVPSLAFTVISYLVSRSFTVNFPSVFLIS